ncbi:hypothetical protein HW132_31855 [Brasilonema sp. CT11]|nr:hypothetical protein [Brasilonema sp. CT11]
MSLNQKHFKGTSEEGNFQAALDEAINNAVLSSGISDVRIQWKIIETSGIRGGIAGENTINVTIEAHQA